jgi:uroporphyrinogen III methyltransferase/synthase
VLSGSLSQSFAVVSGHLPPGHPDSPVDWAALACSADTLVLLMAVANRSNIAQRLLDLGRPPGTAVACIEQAATARQRVTRCTLLELAQPEQSPSIANPAVIVIGPTIPLLP